MKDNYRARHVQLLDALSTLEQRAEEYSAANTFRDRRVQREWLARAALDYAVSVRAMARSRQR